MQDADEKPQITGVMSVICMQHKPLNCGRSAGRGGAAAPSIVGETHNIFFCLGALRWKEEDVMNRNETMGRWHELKGKVKAKWGDLTDDEITEAEGRVEELAGKIQRKYGGSTESIRRELDGL